ncbi:MerR family transcriptional regulator [Amycolatopsis jiangsuensis]|uniref:DNA-binding transcriptional MerR regulator n=1 Tax=Amycolatopsis jiangsuensis TaxID=1181879 RepID=A0A840IYP5_9PSEU|nr:MerR family transcriptional regulator [Amycolatopsis jiangsuensis]MBB4686535.1 DNA-binding transcriptional MerR regulator [Amycolatopsis jiangsuensis]
MTEQDGLTVGRVATLVGVSVKALHHWDAIGLVRPSARTPAGYRVYSAGDVARIHRVLVYRELGFPLAEIGRLLDDPATDERAHLRRQRAELADRITRLQHMASAVERMLAATRGGIQITPEEQVEIFGSGWDPDWARQAEQRWGDTKQWAQYEERTAGKTADDWRRVSDEHDTLNADLAAAKQAGTAPGSAEANELAERHRTELSQYFDCTHAMQVCLGRKFATDPGFSSYYDGLTPGLSGWLRDVIFANAEAHGVDPDTATWE